MTHTPHDGDLLQAGGAVDAAPPQRTHTGPLLVAGEDAGYVHAAFHVAELLARRDRVNAHVLGVLRPLALPMPLLAEVDEEALENGRRRQHFDRIRQRLRQATGLAPYFTVETVTGNPASVIARAARERGAELILVGLEEQGTKGRTATEDSALQVTRAADAPVLAVPAATGLLPKHALVAMDFSPASQRAAQAALPLLAPGGKLTLVYVESDVELETLGKVGLGETHDHSVARLFGELRTSLAAPGDVTVETILLHGDPAAAVLDHASRHDVDLIATGTQGRMALERQLTGSVSTAILRGARCAVLIAPPPGGSS